MTEEEAEKKPCISGSAHNVGRPDEQSDGTVIYRCIGSACMAWRVAEKFGDGTTYRGYCGLAGRP